MMILANLSEQQLEQMWNDERQREILKVICPNYYDERKRMEDVQNEFNNARTFEFDVHMKNVLARSLVIRNTRDNRYEYMYYYATINGSIFRGYRGRSMWYSKGALYNVIEKMLQNRAPKFKQGIVQSQEEYYHDYFGAKNFLNEMLNNHYIEIHEVTIGKTTESDRIVDPSEF